LKFNISRGLFVEDNLKADESGMCESLNILKKEIGGNSELLRKLNTDRHGGIPANHLDLAMRKK
jgi:hypothetical protein